MTIDKQKLLEWIEDRKFIHEPDVSDSEVYRTKYQGMLKILNMLRRDVVLGEFVVDNGEEEIETE